MKLFDGRKHAEFLETRIRSYISKNKDKVAMLGTLAIVQIGDNEESKIFVNLKRKFCEKMDIPVEIFTLDSGQKDSDIIHQVAAIFSREYISGGLIQLPLPRESLEPVLSVIPSDKDIDILSPESKRRFYAGEFYKLPPTVRAFDYFVTEAELDLARISIGVIGYGELVGRPIAHYATLSGGDVKVIGYYQNQKPLSYHLVVSSAGAPKLVDPDNLEPKSYFIDFGSSRVAGKTVGDLNMDKDTSHLDIISPSPGGMGPLVVRFVIMNFLGI